MISNLIIAVKINRTIKGEPHSNYAIVEYLSQVDAEKAVSASISLRGVSLEKDFARSVDREQEGKKASPNYKTKLYLGHLPTSFVEEDLNKIMEKKLKPRSVFVSKPEVEKRYAFVTFSSEAERNMALGVFEEMKQDGILGTKVVVSPAYPYSQSFKKDPRKRTSVPK